MAEQKKISNVVDVKVVSQYSGRSVRQIQHLGQSGKLKKAGHGKYYLVESLQGVIEHLDSGDLKKQSEEARLEKTQREVELMELRIAKEAGELIDAAEAEAGLSAYVVGVNKLLEGLRGNIERTWPDLPQEAISTIDKLVENAREQGKRVHLTMAAEIDDE